MPVNWLLEAMLTVASPVALKNALEPNHVTLAGIAMLVIELPSNAPRPSLGPPIISIIAVMPSGKTISPEQAEPSVRTLSW